MQQTLQFKITCTHSNSTRYNSSTSKQHLIEGLYLQIIYLIECKVRIVDTPQQRHFWMHGVLVNFIIYFLQKRLRYFFNIFCHFSFINSIIFPFCDRGRSVYWIIYNEISSINGSAKKKWTQPYNIADSIIVQLQYSF